MVSQLVKHERIETTVAKVKRLPLSMFFVYIFVCLPWKCRVTEDELDVEYTLVIKSQKQTFPISLLSVVSHFAW